MIKAVYREGKIHPLDSIPREWVDGKSLKISPDTIGSGPAEQFHRLAKAWKEDTRYISSTTDLATHPAYQCFSSALACDNSKSRAETHALPEPLPCRDGIGLEGF